jgi:drug/metabolite transporter (DMT)-like permease
MVVFASIAALWVQTWAQAHMPATRAAIVMTLEPVFAAFFAVTLGSESPTWRMLAGGALVLTAMYAVELLARRRPGELPAEILHHEV